LLAASKMPAAHPMEIQDETPLPASPLEGLEDD
jgi:hypothetical protein